MPFFYELNRPITTNNTTNTETLDLRVLTVANQETCRVVGISAWGRSNTAGGGGIRMKTMATASTGGSSQAPGKAHPNSPAASTTAFTGPSVGATPSVRALSACLRRGGTGGWVGIEPSNCPALLPNGGANGNADFLSIAIGTSILAEYTVEFSEG